MQSINDFLASLPQGRDAELIRDQLSAQNAPAAAHVPYAVDARRDFTRDLVANQGPAGLALGLTMPVVATAEQAGKYVMSRPDIGPIAESILKFVGVYKGSRSGFDAEAALPTIGATFVGALQGLNDRGLFSPR